MDYTSAATIQYLYKEVKPNNYMEQAENPEKSRHYNKKMNYVC